MAVAQCAILAILGFGADAFAAPAEDDEAHQADDAVLWRVLRHRWWRDLPEAPAAPTVEVAGPDSLTVTWSAPDSATDIADYDVEYRAADAPEFTSWGHADTTITTTITGLTPSTVHHVRVRAVNDAGPGEWSPEGEGTTANAAPRFVEGATTARSLPENTPAGRDVGAPVTATDPEGGPLRYSLAGEDAASFDLDTASGQIRTREGVDYDHESRATLTVTLNVDDGLGAGASIEVTVAVTDVNEAPGKPAPPVITVLSRTSLEATWSAPDNTGPPIVDYDVRFFVAGTRAYSLDADQIGTFFAATLSDLDPATDYDVQVRAVNWEDIGVWSDAARGTTLANQPPVFDEGGRAVRSVAENAAAGVDIGDPVEASDPEDDSLTYELTGQDAAMFSIDASTGQLRLASAATIDHEEDANHRVTVTVDDIYEGQASIVVTINVTDVDEPPTAPGAPTVEAAGNGALNVTWSAPANAGRPEITGYNLRYRRSNGAFTRWPATPTDTSAELTGLAAGTYEVQVRALNDEGQGAWSVSGRGTVSVNRAPVVDHGLLDDVTLTVGDDDKLVPVRAAFSDPDGDTLTLSATSSDRSVVAAAMSGDSVSLDAGAVGSADIDVTATDTHGATATGSFEVTVVAPTPPPPPPRPPAPSLSLNAAETELEVTFGISVAALETKAFRVRIRQKNQQSNSRTYCFVVRNGGDEAIQGTVTADIQVGSFALANTTYLVDYRHVGESCSNTGTAPWSLSAEFTTAVVVAHGFDIEVVYVDPAPTEAVKSAFRTAVRVWEQAITNDLPDIDYSADPVSNPCTDGDFDGVVDDVRIYVRVRSIDGAGGTLATAGVCEARLGSGLPIISTIELDADDVNRLGSSTLHKVALHEIAHALGFGVFWRGFLVDPSLSGGDPVTPPPDTHFDGSNAIAAFDDAGGADYQGKKVPVENERGGSGAQDTHWRKSVMGTELMTFSLSSGSEFSAITIQSMADLGYVVDDSVADEYTVTDITGQTLAADAGDPLRPHCIVHPPTDIKFVSETRPIILPASAIQMRAIDGSIGRVEIVR